MTGGPRQGSSAIGGGGGSSENELGGSPRQGVL